MAKILIVEDDKEINRLICEFLAGEGYDIKNAYDGMRALSIFNEDSDISLVILDLMLPYKSGDSVLAAIREKSDVPVLVLSAKDMIRTKVDIIRLGADDYMTKPFDLDELLVRIEALLRRCKSNNRVKDEPVSTVLTHKNMVLNTEEMSISVNGNKLDVTSKEYAIMELFLRNPSKLFSKANLYESVWNDDYFAEDNTLKVHMSNLRNKIKKYDEDEYIETVWGMGYKLK